jgi:hypothetical protein
VRYANAELDRRDKVVGIFPNTASCSSSSPRCCRASTTSGRTGPDLSQQSLARLLHPDGPPLIANLLTEGRSRTSVTLRGVHRIHTTPWHLTHCSSRLLRWVVMSASFRRVQTVSCAT